MYGYDSVTLVPHSRSVAQTLHVSCHYLPTNSTVWARPYSTPSSIKGPAWPEECTMNLPRRGNLQRKRMDGIETEAFCGSRTDRSCRAMDHRLIQHSLHSHLPLYYPSSSPSPSSIFFSSCTQPQPQPASSHLQKLNCFCFDSLVRSRDRV